jgi:hypothetical protein
MVGAYKLNEEEVAQIKNLFEMTTLKDSEIAIMYNVSREHINLIRNGKRWNPQTRAFVSQKELKMIRKESLDEMTLITEKEKVSNTEYTFRELIGMIIKKVF